MKTKRKFRIITTEPALFSYSYLSASTGFLDAALKDCTLTVSKAIASATAPAAANIHQLNSVL